MEAFVQRQNPSSALESRFDYLALVPAAAAVAYPFLLNVFHAIVGMQALTPSPPAIIGATFKIVWCVIWVAIAIWSQSARTTAAAPVPAVGRWRVVHGATAAVLSLYVLFHLTNHLFGLIGGPDAHAARHEDRTRGLSLWAR